MPEHSTGRSQDAHKHVHETRRRRRVTHFGTTKIVNSVIKNSTAVDKASNCPAPNQRGYVRLIGPACDIGAVEVGSSPVLAGQSSWYTPGTSARRGSVTWMKTLS